MNFCTSCRNCHSEYWSTISDCVCCERVICDQCAGTEVFGSLVCGRCMTAVSEVFDQIRPEFFEAVCDLIEVFQGSIPDEPISLEVFRRLIDCKTVAEVRSVFLRSMREAEHPSRERKAA